MFGGHACSPSTIVHLGEPCWTDLCRGQRSGRPSSAWWSAGRRSGGRACRWTGPARSGTSRWRTCDTCATRRQNRCRPRRPLQREEPGQAEASSDQKSSILCSLLWIKALSTITGQWYTYRIGEGDGGSGSNGRRPGVSRNCKN